MQSKTGAIKDTFTHQQPHRTEAIRIQGNLVSWVKLVVHEKARAEGFHHTAVNVLYRALVAAMLH